MISVEQATAIILDNAKRARTVRVPLLKSVGRILREDIFADRDFPPFDRVTMDGIAIRFDTFEQGQKSYPIEAIQAAGQPALTLQNPEHCLEVMTGAILPNGTDTVVRYEDLYVENGQAKIQIASIQRRQNIHAQGIDRKQNEPLILRGGKIASVEIASLATVGKTHVQVSRLPRIAIISTGDELVEIAAVPLAHQIRQSNVFALFGLLKETFLIEAKLFHFKDDEKDIAEGLKSLLEKFDLLILSGAVSEGKYDFVPKVLSILNVEKLFHKVNQRPGKPFWFGKTPRSVIFALPGNPVSAYMCAVRYVLPFIKKQIGDNTQPNLTAILSEDIFFKPDLTYFIPVKITYQNGQILAHPTEGHGSGDLANLNEADGFLELPRGTEVFQAGAVFPLYLYRYTH
jgi:molybdopterin molybdotransferase